MKNQLFGNTQIRPDPNLHINKPKRSFYIWNINISLFHAQLFWVFFMISSLWKCKIIVHKFFNLLGLYKLQQGWRLTEVSGRFHRSDHVKTPASFRNEILMNFNFDSFWSCDNNFYGNFISVFSTQCLF